MYSAFELLCRLKDGHTLKSVKEHLDAEQVAHIRTKRAMEEFLESQLDHNQEEPTYADEEPQLDHNQEAPTYADEAPTYGLEHEQEDSEITLEAAYETLDADAFTRGMVTWWGDKDANYTTVVSVEADEGDYYLVCGESSVGTAKLRLAKGTRVTIHKSELHHFETTPEVDEATVEEQPTLIAKGTVMPKVKKQYEEVMELLMANLDCTVADLMPQLLKVMKSQGGSGSGSTFRKDEQGRVTHVFCYYHKQWEQVKTDFQDGIEYGAKANTATGLNTMCKEGTSAWTKQNRAYKRAKEELLNSIAAGEEVDLPTELANLETEKGAILPHSQAELFSE